MVRCICGQEVEGTEDDLRGGRAPHFDGDGPCPFVACDFETCRARVEPYGVEELRAAFMHWREHRLYGGCSHGR